jgi:hypothetical protein
MPHLILVSTCRWMCPTDLDALPQTTSSCLEIVPTAYYRSRQVPGKSSSSTKMRSVGGQSLPPKSWGPNPGRGGGRKPNSRQRGSEERSGEDQGASKKKQKKQGTKKQSQKTTDRLSFFFFFRCPLRRLWAVCGHATERDGVRSLV